MRFLEQKLWISLIVLAGAAVVLVASGARLGGTVPELKPFRRPGAGPHEFLRDGRVGAWFSTEHALRLQAGSNTINPFFTLRFQPPPPPPTKPVDLLYQGSFSASEGTLRAFVRLGDTLLILTNGARVVADHGIREIGLRRLVLTNAAGVTNILEFNVKKTVEVPAS